MRIPRNKIYRAFPELDRFSDEQCRVFMERVKLSGNQWRTFWVVISVAIVTYLVCCLLVPLSSSVADAVPILDVQVLTILSVLSIVCVPLMVGLLTRDFLLRRDFTTAMRVQLSHVQFPGCKYILIGQRAREGTVTCPECGPVTSLGELAITEADLIPSPASPDVPGRSAIASPGELERH